MRAASSIAIVIFTLVLVSQPMQGEMHAGDSTGLITIQMVDAQTGWAVLVEPSGGTLLARTTDGGTHWKDITPFNSSGNKVSVFQMSVLSSDIAWVMPAGPSGPTSTEIFRTVDGGRTWRSATILASPGFNAAPVVTSISFINPREGWLIAFLVAYLNHEDVEIYHSTDGGGTWIMVARATKDDESSGLPTTGGKTAMTFLNSKAGWITVLDPRSNQPYLYVTRDSGHRWTQQKLPLPPQLTPRWDADAQPPKFFTAQDGIVPVHYYPFSDSLQIGMMVLFYFTHDRGATWTYTRPVTGSQVRDRRLWPSNFADMNHGWVKEEDSLHMTSDGGRQWTTIGPNQLLADVTQLDFISPQVGWAVRKSSPRLLKTLDSGRTWAPVNYEILRQ